MHKILLVSNLRFHAQSDAMMTIPAMGLDSIYAHIDKTKFTVKSVDLTVASDKPREYFAELVKSFHPEVIGFNAIVFTYSEAKILAKIAKTIDENVIIVLGGYHATLDYKRIFEGIESDLFDYIMRGEADISFGQFLTALFYDGNLSGIPNLSYRKDEVVKHNRTQSVNLDNLNLPDRSGRLLDRGYHFFGYPADITEFSRGCIYNCGFCTSIQMYGRKIKYFSPERIVADLKDAKSRGAKAIFVADDNVTIGLKRTVEVFEKIIETKLGLYFSVQASVKGILADKKLPELFARSGVKWVLLGIETEAGDNIEVINKSDLLKNTDAKIAIDRLKKNNILVIGTFIIGLPDDTENTIKASYAYAKRLKPDIAMFLPVTPYPNTPLRSEMKKRNLITNLYDYSKYDMLTANIRTKYIEPEVIEKYARRFVVDYPVESGSVFRMLRLFPKFIGKKIINEVRANPKALWKGIFK